MRFLFPAGPRGGSFLFRGFDGDALAVMVQVLKPVSVAAGQPLFRQADLGRTAFIVVSGSLRIEVEAPTQGSIVVAHVGPGETVGEIALVDPGPRTATAIAEVIHLPQNSPCQMPWTPELSSSRLRKASSASR